MAQATVLAEGSTKATSTDIACTAAAPVTVGIFNSTTGIKPGMRAIVWIDTPGLDNYEIELDHIKKQHCVTANCTARVERVEGTLGVYTE